MLTGEYSPSPLKILLGGYMCDKITPQQVTQLNSYNLFIHQIRIIHYQIQTIYSFIKFIIYLFTHSFNSSIYSFIHPIHYFILPSLHRVQVSPIGFDRHGIWRQLNKNLSRGTCHQFYFCHKSNITDNISHLTKI